MKYLYIFLSVILPSFTIAQGVGIGTVPDSSAVLDLNSNNKGLLIPRMTTLQRTTLIKLPAAGLLVYDIDSKGFWYYSGTTWLSLQNTAAPVNKLKSIYIPATAFTFNSDNGILRTQWGVTLSHNAHFVTCIVPQPVDWDTSKPFTVTLYFSLPNNDTNSIVKWRLFSSAVLSNDLTGSLAASFWTTAFEDASPLVTGTTYFFDVSKNQSWTTKYDVNGNGWYFGSTAFSEGLFKEKPVWQFGFQRGITANNGETFYGPITINAFTITYSSN